MRALLFVPAAAALALAAAFAQPAPPAPQGDTLKPPSEFTAIADERQRAIALFTEASKVLTHPRCMNCHPAGDSPTQTDAMTPHVPMVVRGIDGLGAPGMRCSTCHHDKNFDPARVPGDPMWHLAPIEMAWQGKSLGEICTQIKDPARNGQKDMAELIKHMSEDHLVKWAWNPGADRTPAPGSPQELGELLKAWAAAGAHCPA